MGSQAIRRVGITVSVVTVAAVALLSPPTASAQQTEYRFERMWPQLQQPWYFAEPRGLAVDRTGNLYIANTRFGRVEKYSANGVLLTKWGTWGSNDGQFGYGTGEDGGPTAVTFSEAGYIYVRDVVNGRTQKFTVDGEFLSMRYSGYTVALACDSAGRLYELFGDRIQIYLPDDSLASEILLPVGSGDGQFDQPRGLAVDSQGFIYIADSRNKRIQKLDSRGVFVAKWGGQGGGPGQFWMPIGVSIDSSGTVGVVDLFQERIQLFTSEGQFIRQWGTRGYSDGCFIGPRNIILGRNLHVYVSDESRVQVFDINGDLRNSWSSWGLKDNELWVPHGLAVSAGGAIYVAEGGVSLGAPDHMIKMYTSDGVLLTAWGSKGTGDGQFDSPCGIAVDSSGNVYVIDRYLPRVQKFDSNGTFLLKWGSGGSGEGQLNHSTDIAIDTADCVYVADSNYRIQRFTSNGEFLGMWGQFGAGEQDFGELPGSVAIDRDDCVYVLSQDILRFSRDGTFISRWNHPHGTSNGEFYYPNDLIVSYDGNVYVADEGNRIQAFSHDGQFLACFGGTGSDSGQFRSPREVAVSGDGRIIVTDTLNSRVQMFKPVTLTSNAKAIVVAGGGPFPGNNLWDATEASANFAYRALSAQGFTK
ncbi:MAG: hypothetical protein K1Y02_20390, partial [Candidatus Hydrogenedentes bacterium]|nr:hypothetical protein [Candidatus Hydrogenedentota bacterium]